MIMSSVLCMDPSNENKYVGDLMYLGFYPVYFLSLLSYMRIKTMASTLCIKHLQVLQCIEVLLEGK